MIRLILIVGLLVSAVQADMYYVPNFLGGINCRYDSTNLEPNEAISIKNMTFDQPNVLTSRKGFRYWNVDTMEHGGTDQGDVLGIYIYEAYPDSQKLVVVANKYIYETVNMSDTIAGFNMSRALVWGKNTSGWVTFASNFIYVASDSDTTVQNFELLNHAGRDDILIISQDSSGTYYKIDYAYSDSAIRIEPTYHGASIGGDRKSVV